MAEEGCRWTLIRYLVSVFCFASVLPPLSLAQSDPLSDVLKRLEELEANQKSMQEQIRAKDAQIEELKSEPGQEEGPFGTYNL